MQAKTASRTAMTRAPRPRGRAWSSSSEFPLVRPRSNPTASDHFLRRRHVHPGGPGDLSRGVGFDRRGLEMPCPSRPTEGWKMSSRGGRSSCESAHRRGLLRGSPPLQLRRVRGLWSSRRQESRGGWLWSTMVARLAAVVAMWKFAPPAKVPICWAPWAPGRSVPSGRRMRHHDDGRA